MQEDVFKSQNDQNEHGENSLTQDASYSSKTLSTKPQRFKFEKIHIAYAVTGIAMIFGAYLLLSPLFSSTHPSQKDLSSNQVPDQQWQQIDSPSLPVSGNNYPAYRPQPLNQKHETVTEGQLQSLVTMQQQTQKELKSSYLILAQHIKSIEADLGTLKEGIAKMTQNSDAMQKAQTALGNIENQLQAMSAARMASIDKLNLTAIVDGIAWLEDQNGYTRTVVKNTEIPGYGKVLKIDSTHNKVFMSSGYVFS
ncbi:MULTISPECIES: hypothetical protein [Cysteiniphilum]|uniref:Intracellular multiplication protein IcmG n=1 Tax=Cysteiniphilum litorale TaxID=2056700 RepID=A0A8J2Z3C7_9GAMM|nr:MULTISPECIES: hypothetical protein [Cysteiniphilum]GGF93404.1 hypothetical protein GCM10010995_08180 [Cysteiniphilum litorale]